jgi:drug/metabolite transporter (DMT)-like permease
MSAIPLINHKVRGILWMLATYFGFVLMDAAMKYVMQTLPLAQATWGRFFFATLCAGLFCGRDLPRLARSDSPYVQLLRSIVMMLTTVLFFAGLSRVPLATAATVMYLSPIFVTLLSILLLNEQVGWRRWLGIAVGFLGAIIIVNPMNSPSESAFNSGALLLVFAALANASYQVATRYLRHDDPRTSLLFTAAAGAVVSSFMLPWYWIWPTAFEWVLLVGAGVLGAASHFCLIRAFSYAPASVVAPFAYSSLVWAVLFGVLIWNDLPNANTWLGATLIVSAGFYIFVRENRLKTEKAQALDT